MLRTYFINAIITEVSKGDYAIFIAFIGLIINFIALRQGILKAKRDQEEKFATKTQLDREIKALETQLTLIDKDNCRERENNIREHDSIKNEFVRLIQEMNQKINFIAEFIKKEKK
jgi:hypothetical protein